MRVIGLAGRAGCGKSAVAKRLATGRGIAWIDLDTLAWSTYAVGTDVYQHLQDAFGDGILDDTGAIDRAKLAGAAFADCASTKLLDALVHPAVGRALIPLIKEHEAQGTEILLVEGALLASSPHVDRTPYDKILWLEIEESVRAERLRAIGRDAHLARGCATFPTGDVDIVDAEGSIEDVSERVLTVIGPT